MAATDEMSKHISCGSQTLGSQHLARHHAGPGYSGSAADPNQPSPPWPSRRAVQVIEAQHPVSLSWEDGGLRDAVAAVLDDRDNGVKFTMAFLARFGHDIAIEMISARVKTCNSNSNNKDGGRDQAGRRRVGLALDDVYQDGVPMLGTSLGPRDQPGSSGTLGFYIRLTVGEKEHQCAVTCHHVVAPDKHEPTGGILPVVTPSMAEHAFFHSTNQQAHNPDGPVLFQAPPVELAQVTPGMQRVLGSDAMTSGMTRTAPASGDPPRLNCRLAWACVIMAGEPASQVKDAGASSNIPPLPLRTFIATKKLTPPSNSPYVFKLGRTTAATAGQVNGCHALTRFYPSAGPAAPVRSVELAIIPLMDDGSELFAAPGDSGALVWNSRGKPDSMV
ncbi:hypothetical protein NKR19_g5336 [Coniochaeta hoffmannii]|uniref:Uncharacterized protein n=1 Tax=Coniochaeta hoffmannii TaxID=91930 RepID=A0AA38RXG1_9PEZI|nr:hypothetical protein NKR19_g5336 [Coniochaeta hoffmannii]